MPGVGANRSDDNLSIAISIALFRPWPIRIVRSQTGFDMSDRNATGDRRPGSGEGAGRVALHQHKVWPELSQDGDQLPFDGGRHDVRSLGCG